MEAPSRGFSQTPGIAFSARQMSDDTDFEECMQLLLGAQPAPQAAAQAAAAALHSTHSGDSINMASFDGSECEMDQFNNSSMGCMVTDTSDQEGSPPDSSLGPKSDCKASLRQTGMAEPEDNEQEKKAVGTSHFLAWPPTESSTPQLAAVGSNACNNNFYNITPFARDTSPGSVLGSQMDYGSHMLAPECSPLCSSPEPGSPPYDSDSSMNLDNILTLDTCASDIVPAGCHFPYYTALSHSDAKMAQRVFGRASELGLDPNTAWQLFIRCRHMHVKWRQVLQVLQHCLQDADAAAAALAVGSGCVGGGSCMSADSGGNAIECPSIFLSDGPGSSAAPSRELQQQCDDMCMLAKQAQEGADQKQKAENDCKTNGDGANFVSRAAEARDARAELETHGFSIAYNGYNKLFNAWRINVCGMCADDACAKFVEHLDCLISLDHPGGVLFSVVTGACFGNDNAERVLQVENSLLQCLLEKGGFIEEETGRAGRLGNIVVSLVHAQQEAATEGGSSNNSTTVDPAVMQRLAAAVDAAAQEATSHLEAAHIFSQVADHHWRDHNSSGYTEFLGRAKDETHKADAALGKKRQLAYALHNAYNATANTWRVDLHGQRAKHAMLLFKYQLELLQAVHYPGGVTYQVITGKGTHSEGNVPVIRNAVIGYLQAMTDNSCGTLRPVTWHFAERNEGVVEVNIPGVDELARDIGDRLG